MLCCPEHAVRAVRVTRVAHVVPAGLPTPVHSGMYLLRCMRRAYDLLSDGRRLFSGEALTLWWWCGLSPGNISVSAHVFRHLMSVLVFARAGLTIHFADAGVSIAAQ